MLSIVTQNTPAYRVLPVVGSQLGIWLADQISPVSNSYTVAHYLELTGEPDIHCLCQAICQGLSEADTVHARFTETDSGPVQHLPAGLEAGDPALPQVLDLRLEKDPEQAARQLMQDDLAQPLPAGGPEPLYRHMLLRLGEERWFWYQRYHHICVDGYSFSALTRRIAAIYSCLLQKRPVTASPFVPFEGVIDEYLAYQQSEIYQRDRAFWLGQTAEMAVPVSLSGRHTSQAARAVLSERIGLNAAGCGPEWLMAGLYAYLFRMTGEPRQVAGIPLMRRMGSAALHAVGPVVNVLPLQLQVDASAGLQQLVGQLTQALRQLRMHQRYDAEQVQRDMGLVGLRRPLYTTTINLKIYEQALQLADLQGVSHVLASGPVDDLDFAIVQDNNQLSVEITANADLYLPEELALHAARVQGFLQRLLADPQAPLGSVPLIGEAEAALLAAWSAGPVLQAETTTILDVFQQNAALFSSERALVFGTEELDFAALAGRVAQLARLLIAEGIGREDIVALALPRGIDSVVAILAVLSAGGAYLPLDLDYPAERLAMLCEDAQPSLLLTYSSFAQNFSLPLLCLDDPVLQRQMAALSALPVSDHDRRQPLQAQDLAYIIYTSGSTGKPKGVMVTHLGLNNLLQSHRQGVLGELLQRYAGRRIRAAHSTSFSFDGSWEPLFCLLLGQELYICDEELRRDAQALVELVGQQQIDMLDVPPPLLQQMIACGLGTAGHCPALILIGGEAASAALWREIRQLPLSVHNLYGPTEYTIDTLGAAVAQNEEPVIGRPVANTQIYVLDHALQSVPVGVTGDLYIAGPGLARGYLRRPGQTASRFVANPASAGLMYRTGDLVRWRSDGQLEFIGRADFQIKVRGFRIELGEIEFALQQLPGVSGAVVIAEPVGTGNRLIAYCTLAAAPAGAEPERVLLAQLAEQLPDYMVPAALMILEKWPLNVNGKVDKQALPKVQLHNAEGRAPASEAERLICAGVASVLGLERVSPDDDFFNLGGDSISAMALGSVLRRAGFVLRPRDVFAGRSPAVMAGAILPLQATAVAGTLTVSDETLQRLTLRYGPLAEVLPVLPLQQGLLFHAQLGDAAGLYNTLMNIELNGPLDPERLRDALEAVLQRHPQLAALFDTEGDALQLLPRLNPAERYWPWLQYDLSGQTAEQQAAELARLEQQELQRRFVIGHAGAGPLLQALLIKLAPQQFVLSLNVHHLVVDGWSTPIMLRDLMLAYGDGAETLAAAPASYASVVCAMAAREMAPAREAWSKVLAGVMPVLLFGEQAATPALNILELPLPPELEQALLARSREYGLTMNTLMQGMWAGLLSVLSGRDDVVFGSPVSGRFSHIHGIDSQIGLFTNTLPVRIRLNPHQPLLQQLQAVQMQQIELLEYDGLGLGEIQRLAGVPALFDTLLVVENFPEQEDLQARDYQGLRLGGVKHLSHSHYPLTAMLLPGQPLRLRIDYRDGVSDPLQLSERLLQVLAHLAFAPEQPWAAFIAQTGAEQRLIASLNNTAMPLPEQTLRDLLILQAARTPDAPALQDSGRQLSYREMRREVSRLAQQLHLAGVVSGDIVGVAVPRSVDLSLALMAVIEAGAAYLPLDVGYPDERLSYMVADAKPRLLISHSFLAERFAALGPLLLIDQQAGTAELADLPRLTPDHAAYLLYTSGSTGRPKGVLVSHRAIVNRLIWMQHEYGLAGSDVVLQKTPCSFDVSVWEFFWPLMYGAKLYMAPAEAHRDPAELLQIMQQQQISTLHFVPSMLAAFVAHLEGRPPSLPGLKRVFCSGEALSRELADAYADLFTAPLHNLYGPTEAAVDVTYQPAALPVPASSVPIGRPVWNTRLHVLDQCLREVPLGVAGELYLAGVQLADGYLGRPGLTAGRFVANPFAPGERMYRTGDVVRYLPAGEVEYLGRSDDQLKIRGQRVELGEIEAALLALPGVLRAVVHARSSALRAGIPGSDDRQLIAYVIAGDPLPDSGALRAALALTLPAYMVPVAVIFLDEFPLSANGKLDRKALPAAREQQGRLPAAGLESQIAALFARVLGLASVYADDDFFVLGGHSLLAMRLAAELRRELQLPLTVGQIIVAPTAAKLAASLSDSEGAQAGLGEVLYLRSGKGSPVFFVHPGSGFSWQYSSFARYLSVHWPLIGLQSPRPGGAIAASASLDEVCDQHLANLRRIQPHGPYHLLGYSLGGSIVHGLAAKLQALGEHVAFVGFFDTYPAEIHDWTPPEEEEVQAELATERDRFMAATAEVADELMLRENTQMFEHISANYEDAVRLLSRASTPRYHGKAVLFAATQTLLPQWDIQALWSPYLDELEVHRLDCAHEDILSPDSLITLGPLLQKVLSEVETLSA